MTDEEHLNRDLNATSDPGADIARKTEPRAIPEAGRLGQAINAGGYLFALAIVVSAIILLTEVFLRYVFNAPTIWAHETTTFLCGISFLYGGLFCASRDSHIRVVLIYDALPDRLRKVFDVGISIVSAIAAGFFTYAAWVMVTKATFAPGGNFRLERSGSAWNPPTPALVKTFLLVMLVLMTLQFLILSYNHAKRLGGKSGR